MHRIPSGGTLAALVRSGQGGARPVIRNRNPPDEDLQNGLDALDGVFDDVDGMRDPITEVEIEEEARRFV